MQIWVTATLKHRISFWVISLCYKGNVTLCTVSVVCVCVCVRAFWCSWIFYCWCKLCINESQSSLHPPISSDVFEIESLMPAIEVVAHLLYCEWWFCWLKPCWLNWMPYTVGSWTVGVCWMEIHTVYKCLLVAGRNTVQLLFFVKAENNVQSIFFCDKAGQCDVFFSDTNVFFIFITD